MSLTHQNLAEICSLCYDDPENVSSTAAIEACNRKKFEKFSNLHSAHFFDGGKQDDGDTDAQLYTLVFSDKKIVFAFRGTSSKQDAVDDIQFWKDHFQDVAYSPSVDPKKYSTAKIRVHQGFLGQFNTLKFSIMATLFGWMWRQSKNGTPATLHVYFTGHSLGGALSCLAAAAAKAAFTTKIVATCVTFGSPRAGNEHFVKYFNDVVDNSTRYVNGCDIVTKIPTWGFEHVKGEKCIGAPGESWVQRFFGNAEDHACKKYIESLKKVSEDSERKAAGGEVERTQGWVSQTASNS